MNDLEKYEEVKDQIQAGDCLFFRGNHLASQLIMAFSGPWSHAAIIVEMHSLLWVVEAVSPRVRIRSLPGLLHDYPGEVWWAGMKEGYSPLDIAQATGFAISAAHQELPYDFAGIGKMAFGPVEVHGEKVLCSELLQLAYHYGGFVKNITWIDSPADAQEKYDFLNELIMLVKAEVPEPYEPEGVGV